MVIAFRLLAGLVCLGLLSACVSSAMYSSRIEQEYPPIGDLLPFEARDQHVISQGQGSPVLMIHGASANAREYMISLAPHLEDEAVRLLMADRPGHGHSQRIQNGYDLGRQAAALRQITQQQTDQPVILVGHSFGGAVALRYALDYPDAVRAVVLLAPVTHDWGGGGMAWYNSIAAIPGIGHVFSQFAPLVGPNTARNSLDSLFSPAEPPENYADRMGVDLLFRPDAFRHNARDMVRLRQQLADQEKRYPDELTTNVVIFSGSYDTVIKPKLHAARLRRDAPDRVVLVKLTDEGHMPHHGKSELVAQTILRLARGESVQETDFEKTDGY